MTTPVLEIDAAVIGGGVAGLWLLHSLRARGYSAVLFESRALGAGQTIDSQGIVHSGVKFALDGTPGAGAQALAAMPDTWRDCLAGRGEIDLRRCRVLSDGVHLLCTADTPPPGPDLRPVATADWPAPLRSGGFDGTVFLLEEPVLDMPSLLAALADPLGEAIFSVDWAEAELLRRDNRALLRLPGCTMDPGALVLAAGAGNEGLLHTLAARGPAMQRRPLSQVAVFHDCPDPLFAHFHDGGSRPRLTVSSHRDNAGRPVWYLGGALAEPDTGRDPADAAERALAGLRELLPGLDLGDARCRSVALDRAEMRQPGNTRPDGPFIGAAEGLDNVFAVWPTKLALCPRLGELLEAALRKAGCAPRHAPDLSPLATLGTPPVAVPAWDRAAP